ncbi:MAG TPA: hypothetical protein PLG90_13475, partial [Ignavibacteria bacterium]|nr:hypothetical protein [Ignavibacteria bacterium]
SRIGRWGQVEPLLDKYVSFSPYCYGLNNPMVLVDSDGKFPKISSQDRSDFLNEVANIMNEKISSQFTGIYNLIVSENNKKNIITDVAGEVGDLAGVTGIIKYYENNSIQYLIGIGLTSNFFHTENKYLAAILLDHELFHFNFYDVEKKFKDSKELEDWMENNQKEFIEHEIDAINRSISLIEIAFEKNQISKVEYNRSKASFIRYKEEQQDKIKELK